MAKTTTTRATLKPASAEGGRPTMFPGDKVRPGIFITAAAWAKAQRDAEHLSTLIGQKVSTSNAIEAAIRAFMPARG